MKFLNDELSVLPGFGPKSTEKFLKVGIETIKDALLYYPFRYEDFKSKSVLELLDGEKALIVGEVVTPASVQYYGYKRNRLRFSGSSTTTFHSRHPHGSAPCQPIAQSRWSGQTPCARASDRSSAVRNPHRRAPACAPWPESA